MFKMSSVQNVKCSKCQMSRIPNFLYKDKKIKNNKTQIMFNNKRIRPIQIHNLFNVGYSLPSHLKTSLAILLVVCIFCFCRMIHLKANEDA